MNILVTGVNSGLGRFLHEELGASGISRDMSLERLELTGPLDAIIHCAFNSRKDIPNTDLYSYLDDNIFLTSRLTAIPCAKFVYISSIDVYPKDDNLHKEDETIDISQLRVSYDIMKLLAESIVQRNCGNHLIVRPGLLLGKYTKKNNLVRLLREESASLSLTRESTFNCVLYSDLLCFIKNAMEADLAGIFNAVRSDCISLGDLAENTHKTVNFGRFTYKADHISGKKISKVSPCFSGTSQEAIDEFMKEDH